MIENTTAFQDGAGLMVKPKYSLTLISLRQPEFVFISKEQIGYDPKQKGYVPFWVTEIVAEEDLEKINASIKVYFDAGLKVLWIFRPESNQEDVYTSKNEMTSCSGEAICSAAPVKGNFEIPAQIIIS